MTRYGRYGRGQHGTRADARAMWKEAWRQVHTLGRTHREAALRMGVTHATVGYYLRKGSLRAHRGNWMPTW
jgi:hypothetical protein